MRISWPEVTPEQYEEARRIVHWEQAAPDGAIFHFDAAAAVFNSQAPSAATGVTMSVEAMSWGQTPAMAETATAR